MHTASSASEACFISPIIRLRSPMQLAAFAAPKYSRLLAFGGINAYICRKGGANMKTKDEYIKLLQSCATILREQFGVRTLCLFGSVARNEQTEDSDVDICVEMEPKLYRFVELGMFLEKLLDSRVDVVRMHRNMNALLQKEIEKDRIYVLS